MRNKQGGEVAALTLSSKAPATRMSIREPWAHTSEEPTPDLAYLTQETWGIVTGGICLLNTVVTCPTTEHQQETSES